MKKIAVNLMCMVVLLASIPAFCGADPGGKVEKIKKEKRKVIKFHRVNDDAAWLDFKRGGYGFAYLFPAKVIGVRKVESDGFRFIPAMAAPNGIPQEAFDKFYGFSRLVKEIYIPYKEMKSVKVYYGVTIRTKDGKKYHFRSKHPKRLAKEIRSHLSLENKPGT